MCWSVIPKPTKPEKFWPIAQPAHEEKLVLEAMARLLSEALEPIFLRESREFQVARGARTFFADLSRWPEMDRLVRYDIVNTIDKIDHSKLVNYLLEQLGNENSSFVELVTNFLKADIVYMEGRNSNCT